MGKSYYISLFFLFLSITGFAQSPYLKTHSFEDGYENVAPHMVFRDRNGQIWIGANKGLFSFDGLDFQLLPFTDQSNREVSAVYHDKRGRLWVGCKDGSIWWKDRAFHLNKWMPEEGVPKSAITGICEDSNGMLWFATYGEGLYYINRKRMYNFGMDDGLSGNEVNVICPDRRGKIWVGTDNGISICGLS